jgi:group I intron endonuclease
MKKIGIYKIVSPKGRIYIGQSNNILKRFSYYKNGYCKGQPRLLNSLKKYGYLNHTFSIIEECSIESLDERERYWQEFYKVLSKKGLNCVYTALENKDYEGTASYMKKRKKLYKKKKLTEEHKLKIALSWKYRKVSDETKLKQSQALLGKSKSEAHKKNISKARLGMKFSEESKQKMRKPKSKEHLVKLMANIQKMKKPVLQCNSFGNVIKEWPSAAEAGRELNIASTNIGNVCKGKVQRAGGYIWKYKIL